jgi:hypothetical protein
MSNRGEPGILVGGGGVQHIQWRTEDRENGDLGAVALLVRGSGGSCNLVQEISFHIVKQSNILRPRVSANAVNRLRMAKYWPKYAGINSNTDLMYITLYCVY